MPFSLTRLMACSAALTAALVLAPAPAAAFEQGDFHAGLYTAPGQLFTVKSPLGPGSYLVDGFERSAGAVTFLHDDGRLYGVICTPSYDVLAGADNDFETDVAILRNWFHTATFPHFFEKQIPGAWIASEGPGKFEGEAGLDCGALPAPRLVAHPQGSDHRRTDARGFLARGRRLQPRRTHLPHHDGDAAGARGELFPRDAF